MYLVNYVSGSAGAADYQVKDGDEILWYYGNFTWLPTRISLNTAETAAGSPVTATAKFLNGQTWNKLSGATVYYDALTSVTDSNGQTVFNPTAGYFRVYAHKAGYIKSNGTGLKAGEPNSSSVSLAVDIPKGQVLGDEAEQSIGFTVSPSLLNFGHILPGGSTAKQLSISNTGNLAINLSAQVTGGGMFKTA